MFLEERLARIEELLKKNGKVIVKELAKTFNVTEDCIRKDLKNLESKGILKRTYGGAVQKRIPAVNASMTSRLQNIDSSKQTIADKVYDMLEPMQTIFLDISTTNILIAEKLCNGTKQATVVTNMLDVVDVLKDCAHIRTIMIGGVYNRHLSGFVGSSAIERIQKFKTDLAFIGASGINLEEQAIMTFDIEDGNTKREIISCSKTAYLVVEQKKFYQDGVYTFADLGSITGVVVDQNLEEPIRELLNELSVTII